MSPHFRYTEYIQYYTYDAKSFVADFGGFLGLLLGSSILTFYDLFKKWSIALTSCTKKWLNKN